MAFGTRLRQLRLERGLTQQQLADPAYTAAYVSSMEAGHRRPSGAAIEHLAARLQVEPDELATGGPAERLRFRATIQSARALMAAGDLGAAEVLIDSALQTATDEGWDRERSMTLVVRGLHEEQRGHLEAAIDTFEQAEDALGGASPLMRVDALAGRARCTHLSGDVHYAIHLLEAHLRILRVQELEDPSAIARLHTSLVAAYFDAGLQRQAERSAVIALELAPLVTDPERLANMYVNVARVLMDQKRFEEARDALQKAEDLYIDLHWKNDLGRVYLARGFALLTEERFEDAVIDLDRAAKIFNETGNLLNRVRTELQLARVNRLLHRLAQAKLLLQAIVSQKLGVAERGIAHRELGLCLAEDGLIQEAAANLEQAILLFEEISDPRELAHTYRVLGDLMRNEHELSRACDAYRHAALALEQAA